MIRHSFIIFTAIHLTLLSCRSTLHDPFSAASGVVEISINSYGARANDGLDDHQAFERAFAAMHGATGLQVLYIPEGVFHVDEMIDFNNLSFDLEIRCHPRSKLVFNDKGAFKFAPKVQGITMTTSASRGTDMVTLSSTDNIVSGDIVVFTSSTSYESGWSYKEYDIHKVKHKTSRQVILEDSLVFNYDPGTEEVRGYTAKSYALNILNMTCLVKSKRSRTTTPLFHFRMLQVDVSAFSVKDDKAHRNIRPLSFAGCTPIRIDDVFMQHVEYGILMNFCRDIRISNVTADLVRHAIVPATATIDLKAKVVYGRRSQGVIDAHQAFDISYDTVVDTEAEEFPNCRAIGVSISNARFEVDPEYYQDYAYWSNQLLVPEYHDMYKEHDVAFFNVHWVHKNPSNFNGLTAYSCRNLIVDSCTTHNISLYGKLFGQATISRTEVGSIRINSHQVYVSDCVLNGKLLPDNKYIFRLSGSGQTIVEDSRFVNYNSSITSLFGDFYNQDSFNSVEFRSCKIPPLRSFADRYIFPERRYNGLSLLNSSVTFKMNNSRSIVPIDNE